MLEVTKEFLVMVENLHERKIKCFQTDNGGEYTSAEFDKFLKDHGADLRFRIILNKMELPKERTVLC